MSKLWEFIQGVAAVVVALGIIIGASVGAYNMLPAEWRVATQGWVREQFGSENTFMVLITAKKNISYHEKRKCQRIILNETDRDELAESYRLFEKHKGRPHWYEDMTRKEVCEERGVMTN